MARFLHFASASLVSLALALSALGVLTVASRPLFASEPLDSDGTCGTYNTTEKDCSSYCSPAGCIIAPGCICSEHRKLRRTDANQQGHPVRSEVPCTMLVVIANLLLVRTAVRARERRISRCWL